MPAVPSAPHPAPMPGADGNPLTQLALPELRQRTSIKWQAHPADVLPLWVAEMDVALAPPIADALTQAIQRGDTGYPSSGPYVEAVRAFAARRWAWEVDAEATALVPDVMMGIVEVLRLLTDPGDEVVVCAPVYPPFYAFVTHADRLIREARLGQDGRIDFDALDQAFSQARRACPHPAFLNSNPHNPTGAVHTRSELETVARLARQHGVRVISDEIHAPVVLPGAEFTPYLTISGARDAFALLSASKAWNLAGLKAALLLAGPDATGDLARLPEEVSHGPSHLGVIAHAAAFASSEQWLDQLLAGLDRNRDLLAQLLAEHLPGVHYIRPQGTYLAWLDCSALELNIEPVLDGPGVVTDLAGPAKFFLDHARVALSSGHVFGTGGANHVRLNFATHPDILTDAVTRMGRAVSNTDG